MSVLAVSDTPKVAVSASAQSSAVLPPSRNDGRGVIRMIDPMSVSGTITARARSTAMSGRPRAVITRNGA